MHPDRCPKGHELVWLSPRIALCNECDDDDFIFRSIGYVERLVRFLQRTLLAGHTSAEGEHGKTPVPAVLQARPPRAHRPRQ